MNENLLNSFPEFRALSNRRQQNIKTDRRGQSIPVENDRRMGFDRRSGIDRRQKQQEAKKENGFITFLRFFPPARKVISSLQGFQGGNYLCFGAMMFRAWNEFTEDWHDIKNAALNKPHRPEWQFPFPMIKFCPIEKTWVGKKLSKYDNTVFDLKSVQKFLLKIGMTNIEADDHGFIKIEGSKAAKVLGGAALRAPLLGAALFGIIELDDVIKAKMEDKPREIIKGASRVVVTMSITAILGCVGRFYGRIPELAGLGGGVILGTKLSDWLNTKYDKLYSKLFSRKGALGSQ